MHTSLSFLKIFLLTDGWFSLALRLKPLLLDGLNHAVITSFYANRSNVFEPSKRKAEMSWSWGWGVQNKFWEKSRNWGKGSLILLKKSLLNFFWHSIAQVYLEVLTNYLDLVFILFNIWIDLWWKYLAFLNKNILFIPIYLKNGWNRSVGWH